MAGTALKPAAKLVQYLEASPTPYHAVHNAVKRLEASGFTRLSERDAWELKPNGRYFATRNQSSIIAFTLPKSFKPGNAHGFAIVGAHTDSCNFKLRPISKRKKPADSNYMAIGKFGGGLWHTWLDRDLGIAGRVITASPDGTYTPHLVHLNKPLVRIPTVAIHLDRGQNEKFFYNQETGMQAILGLIQDQVSSSGNTVNANAMDIKANHHSRVLELVAEQLKANGVKDASVDTIHDFELSLFDIQAPTLGGANEEFIFSARLDNLFSSFCAVEGLVEALEGLNDVPEGAIPCISLFDNEEIGSTSAYGAESNFLEAIMQRVVGDPSRFDQAVANSYLLSTDMGHALHPAPDHANKHQAEHKPLMNLGPAIKTNAKIRYASTAPTTLILRKIAESAGVPLQEFEVRNDMACGSTIGPLISKMGLRTVDIGCVQLSMHSIRETGGAEDVGMLIRLFKQFFKDFAKVDKSVILDD
ncbi:aspartyl aminopeptidase [Cystobasidium minutum MCA 4210]|uniref:aspartyl aminopeptidase n=1 Tax=Cystobasidium minutum MCA 4210 TaxID=1397322 RepID=UPI0034CE1403|eukprot:jgi/Rhomi1/147323/e_gw1.8.113.1